RNMNKMAEKVVAVMNERELESMIDDHYAGEAQTLTTGAEANLRKLGELRGTLADEERERREEIKRGFARVQAMGGAEDDPAVKLIGQLGLVSDRLAGIDRAIASAAEAAAVRQEAGDEGDGEAAPLEAIAGLAELGSHLSSAFEPYMASLQSTVDALAETARRDAASPGEAEVSETNARATELRLSAEAAETLSSGFEGFLERTAELLTAARPPASAAAKDAAGAAGSAPGAAPSAVQADFGPYLEKLDATMRAVAEAKGTQVVQTLTPGMLDLLDGLSSTVAENLLPLVQGLDRHMKFVNLEDRKISAHLDRTLKNLDMLRELVASLRKLDTAGLRGPAS
ncbi:MAG: hypothetical protein MI919_22475, partial [Holophagales bacterium]|nr:hypothetical protein [Holophagales bacterium]